MHHSKTEKKRKQLNQENFLKNTLETKRLGRKYQKKK